MFLVSTILKTSFCWANFDAAEGFFTSFSILVSESALDKYRINIETNFSTTTMDVKTYLPTKEVKKFLLFFSMLKYNV